MPIKIILVCCLTFNLFAYEKCYIKLTCKSNLNYVCSGDDSPGNTEPSCEQICNNDNNQNCDKCPNHDTVSDFLVYKKIYEGHIPLVGKDFPKVYTLYSNSNYKDAISTFNNNCILINTNMMKDKIKTNKKATDPKDIYVEISKDCKEVLPALEENKTITPSIKNTTNIATPEIINEPTTIEEAKDVTVASKTNVAPVTTVETNNIKAVSKVKVSARQKVEPGTPQIDLNNPELKTKGEWVTQIENCKDFVIQTEGDQYIIDVYEYAYAKNPEHFIENKTFKDITDANNYLSNTCKSNK